MKFVVAILILISIFFFSPSASAKSIQKKSHAGQDKPPTKISKKRKIISNAKYTGRHLGQCVVGVNRILGRKIIRGWAGAIKPTADPRSLKVGMIILTKEGGGHAGIIIGEDPFNWHIRESNYHLNGLETVGRRLPKFSPLIKGGIGV